jgi:hypothetical protein
MPSIAVNNKLAIVCLLAVSEAGIQKALKYLQNPEKNSKQQSHYLRLKHVSLPLAWT